MEQSYSSMHDLLKGDARAWKYFNMLPDQVRRDINADPLQVHTFSGLQQRAQRLMGGGR